MKSQRKLMLLPFERLVMVYIALTSLLIFVLWGRLEHPVQQLLGRVLIVVGIYVIGFVSVRFFDNKIEILLKVLFQLSLLNFWYPDIYYFNAAFPNLDHLFAIVEQQVFGFQPAITFSSMFPQKWVSELIYFGYFAYYPLIVGTVVYSFYLNRDEGNRVMYLLLGSFFTFYLIYILVPVSGPQFYFLAIGIEDVAKANFYSIGSYFKTHTDIMQGPGYASGLFYSLIAKIQAGSEFPIAAFPSSHVGISTVLMLWMFSVNRKASLFLLPIYFFLCCATVYIRAHYLIDVFAGWIAGVLFYLVYDRLYKRLWT